MRGRQTLNPLKKFGFVRIVNNRIEISPLGAMILNETADLGDVLFRCFIKWQLPNPGSSDYSYDGGYDIKPFIGALHLIDRVNRKCRQLGETEKGINKKEFALFVPTLINYSDIDAYADKIIELRKLLSGSKKNEQERIFNKYQISYAEEFLGTNDAKHIEKLLNNLRDYGDNAIRYFRLTKYIFIRGGGFYIDLEPRRNIEIQSLLDFDNASSKRFTSEDEYFEYLADIHQPVLPYETRQHLTLIFEQIVREIRSYENRLGQTGLITQDISGMNEADITEYIEELRSYRRKLQEEENRRKSQEIEAIQSYIIKLQNIYKEDNKPILLEKYASLALYALNDARNIKPNYPAGDDNEPTFTAPAGKPDIECYYELFNVICEVTMLTGRDQWYNEGQPVMRHLRDFETANSDKEAYCLFVAPKLHRDTINTFWMSVKYEYEGQRQRIIPMSITGFVELLKVLVELKEKGIFLHHSRLKQLYDSILQITERASKSEDWINHIPEAIQNWRSQIS